MKPPKLYAELAAWWPLLSAPEEYEEEAATYSALLLEAGEGKSGTLLELGSGGGNNASYMKRHFRQSVLVDLSRGMLNISRALNPECAHFEGDMRSVRLQREFDYVFVHDAVCYMTSQADLRRAMETAFIHCRPGGVALFCPDHLRENFRPSTDHGGEDGVDRSLRYLEWTWDPDPADTTYTVDYAYLLRDRDGSTHVEHDRHVEGLFARTDWSRLLAEVGFESRVVPFEHSDLEPGSTEVFVARRPANHSANTG